MPLIQTSTTGDFIQAISDEFYTGMVAKRSVNNGYLGAEVQVVAYPASIAAKLEIGTILTWWEDGRPLYRGRVVKKKKTSDSWSISISGCFNEWLKRQISKSGGVYELTQGYYTFDLAGVLLGDCDALGYGVADSIYDLTWRTASYIWPQTKTYGPGQTIEAAFTDLNKYDFFEYGGYIRTPGADFSYLTDVYYRKPDSSNLHYVVDMDGFITKPGVAQAGEGFFTNLAVWYGATPTVHTASGSSSSIQKHGSLWGQFDISGEATTLVDAVRVTDAYFEGIRVDGVETPPVSISLTLKVKTPIIGGSGACKYQMWMEPGQNIMVLGLSETPRSLGAIDNRSFFHIETITYYQAGEVSIECKQMFDPAKLLAKFKRSVV